MKHMSKTAVVLYLCLMFFIGAGMLEAQQTGDIQGRITDEEGEPLPGVGITARSPKLQGTRTAVSDQDGRFRLPLLPVGEYSLTLELAGFEKLTTTGNTVQLGATLSVSIALKIATLSEEVTVTAVNPLIDKTKADNSYRLTSDVLALVPTQARSIEEVISYTPGVTGVRTNTVDGTDTGSPSFRGEGDFSNNWFVDGFPLKSATYNDLAIKINYDSWDEIQIVSDAFSPEYGQALGGYVNIVTKSGGNTFHGELGGLFRDSHLRANRQEQLSAATVPETSFSDYFGNLGGPILKDRLWFFLSNNFHRTSDITQEQPIGWLTIPAGNRRFNTNSIFGKVTYTPQRNHTFSLSTTLDTFLNQSGGIGLPEAYSKETHFEYFYRLNYRGIISQNTLLTATIGHYQWEREELPISGDFGTPSYYWLDIGQTTHNIYSKWIEDEQKTDLAVNFSQYISLGPWGEHEIKLGMTYTDGRGGFSSNFSGHNFDPWIGNGFDNGIQLIWENPGVPSILEEYGNSGGENSLQGFGFYAGDTVTVGRFAIEFGLRTGTQKVFNDIGEPIWTWGIGDFLTPRFSVAFDLFGDSNNIIKFGFGQFAQPHSIYILPFFNTVYGWNFRDYYWIGAEDPTEAQLKDPSNWTFVYEQSGAASPISVDPDLKPNRSTKFLLEFDRQLGQSWALKVRGIYSYMKNITESVNFYDPETIENLIYTNFDIKRRDYKAVEIELSGKIAKRFMLSASYTWSEAKGTHAGNSFERLSWSAEWGYGAEISMFGHHLDIPEGDPNKEFYDWLYKGLGGPGAVGDEGWYGFLPYSVDHVVKILGTYFAPFGFVASSAIEYLSGYHWEKKEFSPGMGHYFIYSGGRGSRTTPAHMFIDLAVEKEFILKGIRLNAGINVYNLLNSQRPVSYVNEDTDLFGNVWGRQLPRWMQIKLTLRF